MAFRSEGTGESGGGREAYRICRDIYPILDGGGAAEYGGRWNSPGRRIVYSGASFAIVVLERLVYLTTRKIPTNEVYARFSIPEDIAIERVQADEVPGWDRDDWIASRAYGDRWYDERRSPVLLVPSVVTRIDENVLISQSHPDFARISASTPESVLWDARLFRT